MRLYNTKLIHCSISEKMIEKDIIVAEREFFIWRLEKWWVFSNFYPEHRKHLKGSWYWRMSTKKIKIRETSKKLGI